MIDSSEKCNRQLAFELQNAHVCEKRSNVSMGLFIFNSFLGVSWLSTSTSTVTFHYMIV